VIQPIAINGTFIGKDYPPYIVAEISGNHNGSLSQALELITQAKNAGADAVKLQSYTPDSITIDHDAPEFLVKSGLWKGRTLYELYQQAHTPPEWHKTLVDHAKSINITLFSSPFDETAVDFLEALNMPAYKIASPEIVDLNLIEKCAKTGKPLIISTGMANLDEIDEALAMAYESGANQIVLLHCVSAYPTPIEQSNLYAILELRKKFKLQIGLSDHTKDIRAATVSIGLGAVLIEKHLTLSRSNGGVDNAFSLEPKEFKDLVLTTKLAYSALGSSTSTTDKVETEMLFARRSLYIVANVKAGEVFTKKNIRSIRPNLGLRPKYLKTILGKRATRDIKRGEPVNLEMVRDSGH